MTLCVVLGFGMGMLSQVTEGWQLGGYRRVGADSWKLALTVAAVALCYRLTYVVSIVPGMLARSIAAISGYVLAAVASWVWYGSSKAAMNHVWMWGLLLVLGMAGVELHKWRKSAGVEA